MRRRPGWEVGRLGVGSLASDGDAEKTRSDRRDPLEGKEEWPLWRSHSFVPVPAALSKKKEEKP